VDRGSGVISDPAIHERVLHEIQEWVPEHTPLRVRGLIDSPIQGRDGNREFLMHVTFEIE
jgi:23S rRNA (cytidine1920-2'-O)/16S rRNA (cytidine1409-2'-O)-methyltransferase